MEYELLIRNGTIVDGQGQPAFKGHLAVNQGRIVAIRPDGASDAGSLTAGRILDAAGLTVAPGFIDIHSHHDFILPLADHPELMSCTLEQGVTTIVGGNCGFSPAPFAPASRYSPMVFETIKFLSAGRTLDPEWTSMDDFFRYLEQEGVAVNLVQLAGHGSMRISLWGRDNKYPGPRGLKPLESLLDEALDAGAYGLSFGLGYEPGLFVQMEELERLAVKIKARNAILAVHLKAFSRISPAYGLSLFGEPHNLRALKEMIGLAEKTGVRLQISHLIFVGRRTWPTCDQALQIIEQAHERGVDAAFDSFPYTAGNTTIYVLFPDWFLKDVEANFNRALARLRLAMEWRLGSKLLGFGLEDAQLLWGSRPELDKYNGWFFPEIARDLGCSVPEAYIRLGRMTKGQANCLFHKYSGDRENEDALRRVLAHPLNTFETDAHVNPHGAVNPGAYGTFPRLLQRYCRELHLFSLEEAVAKMTGRSAARLGLTDRGLIREGYWADLTIFDMNSIKDNTSVSNTRVRPSGIEYVFINGHEVVTHGRATPDVRAGQVLRRR
ncbi:MAG: amidohydrolase family protein [Deltaproteobacteria bacterium]|nr:amidohydrolase family protein [Deltaproteobacteria bacterium]